MSQPLRQRVVIVGAGWPAWLVWCFVHIQYLIGFRNRFIVMFEWARAYFSYQRGGRLITGELDASLGRSKDVAKPR